MYAENVRKIGLIAGEGDLPLLLAEAISQQPIGLAIIGIEGFVGDDIAHFTPEYTVLPMTEIARTLPLFRQQGVSHILTAGKLARPSLLALRPFWYSLGLLCRIGTGYFGGDDAMFKAIIRVLQREGFELIGADEVLHDLLTPEGVLTEAAPNAAQQADIALGIQAARRLGLEDKGQAVIVYHGTIIAQEDASGTAALIKRAASLRGADKGGILVKVKKPQQERRIDLPSIGPDTLSSIAENGLNGIALEANETLILRREEVIAKANQNSLFVVGV